MSVCICIFVCKRLERNTLRFTSGYNNGIVFKDVGLKLLSNGLEGKNT